MPYYNVVVPAFSLEAARIVAKDIEDLTIFHAHIIEVEKTTDGLSPEVQ